MRGKDTGKVKAHLYILEREKLDEGHCTAHARGTDFSAHTINFHEN